jgi:hypothetical protein
MTTTSHGEMPHHPTLDGQHQAKIDNAANMEVFHTSECRKGISRSRCCGWQSRLD